MSLLSLHNKWKLYNLTLSFYYRCLVNGKIVSPENDVSITISISLQLIFTYTVRHRSPHFAGCHMQRWTHCVWLRIPLEEIFNVIFMLTKTIVIRLFWNPFGLLLNRRPYNKVDAIFFSSTFNWTSGNKEKKKWVKTSRWCL